MFRVGVTILLGLAVLCGAVDAQVLRGLVLDGADERPIAAALVGIERGDGEPLGFAIADSAGRYSLETPGPGEYRIVAEAPGYHPFRSLLLEVGPRPAYAIDVELRRAPVPLPGLVVTAERSAELERGLRRVLGVHPRSLRFEPILRPVIERHLERAHTLEDLMRWSGFASIVTRRTTEGPCFQWRNRHCLSVHLNGVPVRSEFVPVLPLDMIEAIVVMPPRESARYMGGAVLLFTAGWIH